MDETGDRHLFVIIGATGDLARRKLLPALYRVITENAMSDGTYLLGAARHDLTDEEFRSLAEEALLAAGHTGPAIEDWCAGRIFYESLHGRDDFGGLTARIEAIESAHALPGNRALYLALPPRVFPDVIAELGRCGLNRSAGWSRIVIEKPVRPGPVVGEGAQLARARALRRAADLSDRSLSGQGDRPEPADVSLRPIRSSNPRGTATGSKPSRSRSQRTSASAAAPTTTTTRACCATWCRATSPN